MIQQKVKVMSVDEPWATAKLIDGTVVQMRAFFIEVFQCLNDDGTPMDDLVGSYYKRYMKGYLNTFSVGMESMDPDPERLPTGGHKFKKSRLYEVSPVSIPANQHAIGLTRSFSDEDTLEILTNIIKEMKQKLDNVNSIIDTSFKKAFEPLEARLDILESTLVNQKSDNKAKEDTSVQDFAKQISNILDKHK